MRTFDFLVVGGGISGVASACELAAHGDVLLLEREAQLAYHTTGRSAAISMEGYGNATIRALTVWSTSYLKAGGPGRDDASLWAPRGALILADRGTEGVLDRRIAAVERLVPTVRKVDGDEVMTIAPHLRPGRWTAGMYEPNAFDLDVHAIHSSYLRSLRARSGQVMCGVHLSSAKRLDGTWRASLSDGSEVECSRIVNAAGAWADDIAERAGVLPCGLRALRRTVVLIDPKIDARHLPYVGTVDERVFIKPEAGGFMVSPCDEVPSEPCDAVPDEMDVAVTMERLDDASTINPGRIKSKWAGLRTFVADRSPVIGCDPDQPGFVWLAGVGGYGIQAGPAMARICAAAALGEPLPTDFVDRVKVADLSPDRCRTSAAAPDLHPVAELC